MENTRNLIENIDYAAYAEMCSEKSLNARKAGKECTKLFHCLLLKEEGPRVYESLVFDVDSYGVHLYIDEINIHHTVKVKEDSKVQNVMFFEEELKLSLIF